MTTEAVKLMLFLISTIKLFICTNERCPCQPYYPRLKYTYRNCHNFFLFHLCFFKSVTFPFPEFFCHLCLSYCVESMTRTNLLHINKADN